MTALDPKQDDSHAAASDSGERATAVVNGHYRSSSSSVRYIKHNYPDQRDKSERHKRRQGHSLLP
jgi:hypothetical protein